MMKSNPAIEIGDIKTSNDINIFNSQSVDICVSDNKEETVEPQNEIQEQRESDLNEEQGYTKVIENQKEKNSNESIKDDQENELSSSRYKDSSIHSKEKSSNKNEDFDKDQIRNIDDFVNTDLNNKEMEYESEEDEDEEDYKNHIRKLLGKNSKINYSNEEDLNPFSNNEIENPNKDNNQKDKNQKEFNDLIKF